MTVTELITTLREQGIRIRARDQELEIDAPQGVLTAELRAELANRKPELLRLLSWSRRTGLANETPLQPVPRNGQLPLSWSQQRLWFLDQLEPHSSAYNISWTVRLKGELHLDALQAALNALVQRHESLRTVFPAEDGVAVQQVLPHIQIPIAVEAMLGVADEKFRTRLSQLAAESFDLANGPLLRVTLIQQEPSEHVLLVLIHHIVADGASMRILFRELAFLYEANVAGKVADLPELAVQYADYAVWQRNWLDGEEQERQADYWRNQLEGLPPLLELPWDRPRSAAMRYRGASVLRVLPASLADALRKLGREQGCTLFMVMLAAFYVLLMRYSGRTDLVVGTPMGGRPRTELEGLIGFFINTAVLRADLDGDPDFSALLGRVRNVALEAHANQELPFEKLVEILQPERELSYSPVFQVMFDLQEEPRWRLPVKDLQVVPEVVFSSRTSSFDLTLSVRQAENGLDAMFEYDTDLFDESTIERMAEHYQTLLDAIVTDASRAISSLPLLGSDRQQQLIDTWGSLAADYPADQTLAELIAARARQHPAALAVEAGDARLSYGELHEQALALAATLHRQGVGRQSVVAVCAARDPEFIVAQLAVLHAGACVMPLDPHYPQQRLQYMLADSGAAHLLVSAPFAATMQALQTEALQVMVVGEQVTTRAAGFVVAEPAGGSDELAFLLYTSGTTGQPKGVELPHRGLVNYIHQLGNKTGVQPGDRLLQFASPSFDIAIEECFTALAHGATLVFRDDEMADSVSAFLSGCAERRITWLSLPTAWWHELCRSLSEELLQLPESLRCVVIGGEKASLQAYRDWRRFTGTSVRLINTYGPTETSIVATWSELTHLDTESNGDLPIGHPVPNVRAWVLDEHLRPLPAGVPGDLYIGGVGVARGYHNRAALTAEQFIADPFAGNATDRLYRTGDRARYTADGRLLYLGRRDQQLKLRGHRIEPGEIEAALNTVVGVHAAAVVSRVAANGECRLLGFVQSERAGQEVAAALAELLPAYMLPSAIVCIDALPLTANGKVDRARLAELEPEYESGHGFEAPRNDIEIRLAAIWSAVLERDNIGIHDNFFELGGHSLLATRVVARVRDQLGQHLPLREIFSHPTIAGLSARLEQSGAATNLEPVRRYNATDGLPPLSWAQERLWMLDQLEPQNLAYTLPWVARLTGELNPAALQLAINQLVDRHAILRTRFGEHAGRPVQIVAPEQRIQMQAEMLSASSHEKIQQRLQQLAAQPFELHRGPLLRVHLLQAGASDHILLLLMHHIVADGWSMGVICRELSTIYNGLVSGQDVSLPQLPYQYVDYAVWQRNWLSGDEIARQIGFWSEQLKDVAPLLELPADYPRPATQSYRGAWVSARLERTELQGLKQLGIRTDSTLFMVLLAGFKSLVLRHAGISDVVVGTPIAGRVRTELEPMVGCFLNTLVLRTQIDPQAEFLQVLDAVKETTLNAFEHQDLPFERLLEILKPERSVAHAPLVQLMFNLHNAGSDRLNLQGLNVESFNLERDSAKFDLSVAVVESTDGLQIGFEYNTDLFARRTIKRLLKHYLRLLESVVESPDTCIADVVLAEAYVPPKPPQRRSALADSEFATSLAARFESVVTQFAERPAVECGAQRWSYRELNAQANAVAAQLTELGIAGKGQPVGLLLAHDAPMLAGLLGVIKAGCAYVPLDRQAPAQRLAAIISAGELAAVVTVAELQARLPEASKMSVVHVPSEVSGTFSNPELAVAPDALAYVLFTSGSTGTPKGVMQTHRNVLHHVRTYVDALQICEQDRLSLFSAYGFDAAVMDIFGALLTGACLVPVDVREVGVNALPAEQINQLDLSILHATPTVYRYLFADARAALRCQSVRVVVLGGEEVVAEDFAIFRRHFAPPALFVNGLGPSESTLATQFIANHETQLFGGVVPVGNPVAGTTAVLLDDAGQPTGCAGELGISSAYVSTGYWQQPELTQQRFQADKLQPGSVLYRTGDRVRRLPDGQLAFMGRTDAQLKLRGHRIEPGEIEAAINAREDVLYSAVTLLQRQAGAAGLLAYVVGKPGTDPLAGLREFLQRQLPDYMVPTHFVALDKLPLTQNGKLDKRALPEPEWTDTPVASRTAPRTETERRLAAIWSELLGIPDIGVHDDFFKSGGHSLLAMQVVARVRSQMRHVLSLRDLFSHPSIEQLAVLVDNLAPTDESYPLQRRPADGSLPPLSWAQQRLWFLDRLEPDSVTYNLHWAARLSGALDAGSLQNALNALVDRHESLRTIFGDEQHEPVQLIQPELHIELQVETQIGASAERLQSRVAELIRQPFNLQRGPLLRCYLLRQSDAEGVLLLVMPHIISDGWSMGILFEELAEFYAAQVSGREPRLRSLPVQYADYAIWQREWLSGPELARQSAYWKSQLSDAPVLIELPLDHPRPPVQRFRGAWVSREFDAQLLARLTDQANASGVTLFMLLLAAFKVLLARYTGQEDIVIGTPVAGRRRVELEGLIGFFLNTLVLRTSLAGNPDFSEVLRRVQQTTLDAYEYQDLPFEKLLEILQPPRSTAHTPVVQVMFNLHNEPADGLRLAGVDVRPFPVDRGTSKFDLSVAVIERSRGLHVGFEYNTDLFERDTVELLLKHFGELLQAVADEPHGAICAYQFSPRQTLTSLVTRQDSQSEASGFRVAPEATVVSRFAEVVARYPDNEAVRMGDAAWSYSQLDRLSSAIAGEILSADLQRCRVGILLGHDELAVAALLGTLKAGCAYVPLDQHAPPARLAQIIADADLTTVLTDELRAVALPAELAVRVVTLDTGSLLATKSLAPQGPAAAVSPDDLAYILFTSGSTGTPKGVMQTQHNVLQQIQTYSQSLQISATDRLTLFSAYGFDAAVMDIYGALLNGACLHPLDIRDEEYSGAILDRMTVEQVTLLHSTPTVFRFLMRQKVCRHELDSIRAVVLGGEEALSSDFDLFKKQFAPPTLFVNGLGPSESTLALQFIANHRTRLPGSIVPIGRPVPGVSVTLIDDSGEPAGLSGEIVLESACLSIGYWQRDDLSRQHFAELPDGVTRSYRTGDRARILPDGQFVFLGRSDKQVKVRGHRIELSEIEIALAALPEVENCAVVLLTSGKDSFAAAEANLVAYVVGDVTTDTLRGHLRSLLPDYMVPAFFVVLDDLPLLSNGKLDRAALPTPDWSRNSAQAYTAPRTDTERHLASVWSEVLGIRKVGVHDDFFELGGHSLLAAQLVARITDVMQVGLPLRRLFDAPTIAALAEHVDALQWALQAQQSD